MLSHVTCPSCEKVTVQGLGRCEWCGARLTEATPIASPTGTQVYPDKTTVEHNVHGSWLLICTAVVLIAFSVWVLVGGPFGWGAVGILFSPFLVVVLGFCPLGLGLLCLGVAVDLSRRAKAAKTCAWCRGQLVLQKIVDTNPHDEDAPREYYYRCASCGREKVQVDA